MNRKIYKHLTVSLIFLLKFNALFGQISKGGTPLSISTKMSFISPKTVEIPTPDMVKVAEEDKAFGGSPRFAVPISVDFTTENVGNWTILPNGNRLWRLKIHAEKAQGLAFTLNNFELPKGAKLFVYSPDEKQILGAYDAANNAESQRLMVGPIKGDEAIIEYFEPASLPKKENFRVATVYHVYNNLSGLNFGDSQPCEININCSQGAAWQQQKRGIARILVNTQQGLFWCSGSLINNTKQDGTPYMLSAFHCVDGRSPDYSLFTFYFNFESPNCANPATQPASQSLQGCVARSSGQESDFLLLELSQKIPTNFNAFFNGWNRDSTVLPTKNTMIHHPNGDIKKISLDNDPPIALNTAIPWANNVVTPPNSHIQSIFDQGTIEPGSSGSPIFDTDSRIIGQLHGGDVSPNDPCIVQSAISGWFSKSWAWGGTPQYRLKEWLDPTNSGVLALNGSVYAPTTTATVSGKVQFWRGQAMPNVKVFLGNDSTTTNASGVFSFPNVALNTPISVRLGKTDSYDNGLEGSDILFIKRFLLDVSPLTPFKLFCADVDKSGDIDGSDVLFIRRFLLSVSTSFKAKPWQFISTQTTNNPNFPFGITEPSPLLVTFTGNMTNLDFLGFKSGDVDGTADLGQ